MSDPIRVLQVVGTMDMGGAETFLMNLYRNIDREQLQFDFLCHNRIESQYADEIRALGGRMFCVDGPSHVGAFGYLKQLYTFFVQHPEYKVVHAHQNDMNGMILMEAKRAGIKHRYSHSHTVYVGKSLQYKIRIAIFQFLVNTCTTDAFACSVPAGEGLYRGRLKRQFQVVQNGIDTECFSFSPETRQSVRNELKLGEGPVIGHVGRFAPVKNHRFILACFRALLQRNPKAQLMLIGTGELEHQIKTMVQDLSIADSVHFLGARTDVFRLMNAMDIFLFPSINEGLPVSVVEAQASGLQVLMSDSVSEDTVLTDLVSSYSLRNSPEMWADKLEELTQKAKLCDRKAYPALVKEKGFDAKQVADQLTEKYMADSLN